MRRSIGITLATMLMAAVAQPPSRPLVTIDAGPLAGTQDGGVEAFLGVPFAAPTGGANRWRAPQPVTPWTAVRDASHYGASCEQADPVPMKGLPWTAEYLASPPLSEDCLFLNVWTPRIDQRAKLPVLVWIHGGGFGAGSGAIPIYRGSALARRGLVVITINYRLGVFGFLAHPALSAEAGGSGNYGLQDQIAALDWVRRNIARFGGDSTRVTIAGQSAGAASVDDLMQAPAAQGLFIRAIAESSPGPMAAPIPLSQAEARGVEFLARAHAENLATLRALPVKQLLAAAGQGFGGGGIGFSPVLDGKLLLQGATEREDIALLTGANADEASANRSTWQGADIKALNGALQHYFGARALVFARLYPVSGDRDASAALHLMLADRPIAAIALSYGSRPAAAAPVYAYRYTHPEPGPDQARFGTFHTAEVPYVFGTLDAAPTRPFTTADFRIADEMQRYWANFVKTGNPNGAGLPRWPSLASGQVMNLGDQFGAADLLGPMKLKAYQNYVASGGILGLF